MKHIFLYGPPGSGKSSAGKALAERLHWPFVDLDQEIEKQEGRTVSRILEEEGEAAFRDMETEALMQVSDENPRVIALGGGA